MPQNLDDRWVLISVGVDDQLVNEAVLSSEGRVNGSNKNPVNGTINWPVDGQGNGLVDGPIPHERSVQIASILRPASDVVEMHLIADQAAAEAAAQRVRNCALQLPDNAAAPANVCLVAERIFNKPKRLVIFDMDSTLIQQETVDELANMSNLGSETAETTERAMRGEIDFDTSFKERWAYFKGVSESILDRLWEERIRFTPGAEELCELLKSNGAHIAVVSGGLISVAKRVKVRLGLDYAFASEVEVLDGKFTGKTGALVNKKRKGEILRNLAQSLNIDLEETIAIGDGANDLDMIAAAGIGIAFNGKPIVQERAVPDTDIVQLQARICWNNSSLAGIQYLVGVCKAHSKKDYQDRSSEQDKLEVNHQDEPPR